MRPCKEGVTSASGEALTWGSTRVLLAPHCPSLLADPCAGALHPRSGTGQAPRGCCCSVPAREPPAGVRGPCPPRSLCPVLRPSALRRFAALSPSTVGTSHLDPKP